MHNGISSKIDLFDGCSGCKGCGAWKDEKKPVQRLHLVLTRGNAAFVTDICSGVDDARPTEQTVAAHLAFLAATPTDPDDLRSDKGYLRPSIALAHAEKIAALRGFFTPDERERLRSGTLSFLAVPASE